MSIICKCGWASLVIFAHPAIATDLDIPNPVTYEWTVGRTQKTIPRLDLKDTPIRDLIGYLGNSMSSPIRLKHNIPDELLDQRLNWNFKEIRWIDVVAKIADLTDSHIRIEKKVVTLVYAEPEKDGVE